MGGMCEWVWVFCMFAIIREGEGATWIRREYECTRVETHTHASTNQSKKGFKRITIATVRKSQRSTHKLSEYSWISRRFYKIYSERGMIESDSEINLWVQGMFCTDFECSSPRIFMILHTNLIKTNATLISCYSQSVFPLPLSVICFFAPPPNIIYYR